MNQNIPTMPEIGKAAYGRSNFGGHGWFHIEDNKDNIFRVLPPMKSLAREGKYAKFYSTHRGFRGTDNKQRPFLCIEESDYKTKVIKVHCPVCDWVDAIEKHVATFKEKGATDDQIRDYRNKYLFPFQAERKYYLNVVNQEGKIGVLPIGSKMFKSLEALAMEQEKQGRDITGMEGIFLNFKKQTRFKGDRDAIHTANLYMQPTATGFTLLTHVIDQAFAQKLATDAADLGKLFKSIQIEQMAQIIALEGEARAKYVDTLFEKEQAAAVAPVTAAPAQAPVQQPVAAPASALPTAPAAPVTMAPPTAATTFTPPAPAAAAPTFTPPAPAAPVTQQTFTPPGNAIPAAPAGAMPGFGPSAPVAPVTGVPLNQLDDTAFANMVRPQKG